MFGEKPLLETVHPRIISFYVKYPHMDFETVNLFIVDFFEKIIINHLPDNLTDHLQNQMMVQMVHQSNKMDDINRALHDLKESVHMIGQDVTNTIMLKFLDIKRDYIEEFKVIVNANTTSFIHPLLEKHNEHLIDKTILMIQEVLPKSQYQCFHHIQDTLHSFHKTIIDETHSLIHSVHSIDNNKRFDDFIDTFEQKSSQMLQNIQQPIFSYISSSEERIHSNLAAVKDISIQTQTSQEKWNKTLAEKMRTSPLTIIPTTNEQAMSFSRCSSPVTTNLFIQKHQIHLLLNKLFPTADVSKFHRPPPMNVSHNQPLPLTTNIYSLKRQNRPSILIESRHIDHNVDVDDVHQFIDIIKTNNNHGIFISQKSGICTKPNYLIECHDKSILIYIHEMDYDVEKLKIGVDIIDQLYYKIKQYATVDEDKMDNENEQTELIDKCVLNEINQEYQLFITQKNAIIQNLRESQRKIISQIEEFQFVSLDKYLSSKFTAPMPKNGHKCDLCKMFHANNLKALAAHKRGCIRKMNNQNMVISTMEDMTN